MALPVRAACRLSSVPAELFQGFAPQNFQFCIIRRQSPAVSRMPAAAELQGGFTPTKQKFCAIRPPAPSSGWFAALLAASPMPAAFPLEAPAAVAVPRWASVGRLPPLARLRPLQLRLRGSGPRPRLRPRRLCLFLLCLCPVAFPGWPQGRKNPNRGGRCQTRSRERFPDVAAAPAQAKGKSSSGGAAASPWLFCGASPQKWERSTMNSVIVRLLPSAAK